MINDMITSIKHIRNETPKTLLEIEKKYESLELKILDVGKKVKIIENKISQK